MTVDRDHLRRNLDDLVRGTTALQHGGQFDEPNLDGTAGDYISFHSWEWPQGVALYGLVRLWMQSGDPALLATIEDWYARQIAKGLPRLNINTTAPMLALSLLWRETRDPRWEPVLKDWAERVVREAPRTFEGAFQHDVSDKLNEHELWDDTLFMGRAVPRLLRLGGGARRSGRRGDLPVPRPCPLSRRPQDRPLVPRLDLRRTAQFRRGALGAGQLLDHRLDPRSPRILGRAEIGGAPSLGILNAQVETLLACQAASGAWHTLLDDPGSYEEISATAGFGYGLLKGARLGIGGERWRQAGLKALSAVLANIEDGTVQNVSYGTRMGHDLDFYRVIPIQPTATDRRSPSCASAKVSIIANRPSRRRCCHEGSLRGLPRRHPGLSTRRACAPSSWSRRVPPGAIEFVYTHVDRLILGGAVPTDRSARLRRRGRDRHTALLLGARGGHRQSRGRRRRHGGRAPLRDGQPRRPLCRARHARGGAG